jgi:two-component sensor histidine kinase
MSSAGWTGVGEKSTAMPKRTPRTPDPSDDIPELRRRHQELLESLRATETLLREVHHRVKNNLQVVVSLLTLQAGATNDRTVARTLCEAATRVSSVALIHAMLSESTKLDEVDFGTFIRNLVSGVQRTFGDSTTTVALKLDLEGLVLPIHLATPCALLVNELVTNAFRHAFDDTADARIEIRADAKNGVATLVVRDNGHGLPQDGPGQGGMGFQLMQRLAAKQLRGNLSVSRVNGTEVTVKFPYGSGGTHGAGQGDDR